MNPSAPTVFVVDDDDSVRAALVRLLHSVDFQVQAFPSASALLECDTLDDADCVVLDVHLPDLNGLDLQDRLVELGIDLPLVFISGRGDIPMSVRAMKAGALEFFTKPIDDEALISAIRRGAQQRLRTRQRDAEIRTLQHRYRRLTPREREVLALVVRGRLNKQAAAELGLAEKTIKVHRGQVMRKMQASSLPDLVLMAQRLSRASQADPELR